MLWDSVLPLKQKIKPNDSKEPIEGDLASIIIFLKENDLSFS